MQDRPKALIVDDETDVCFLLSSILKNKSFQAICVNTISEARKALTDDPPSVIFLDNHLPDGFGVNFIKEIKRAYPGAKIIMITAHDTKADKEKAYSEGVDQFIGKPFTREDIFSAIESTSQLKDVKL